VAAAFDHDFLVHLSRHMLPVHLEQRHAICKLWATVDGILLLIHKQVNWPKLNTPPWAIEGYQDALVKVRKHPVVGSFIKGHERGRSTAVIGYMEEGKKRKE
jgi:hypothetical protein